MKNDFFGLGLFPNVFKKVEIGLAILSLIASIVIKSFLKINLDENPLLRHVGLSLLVLGLYFWIMAKEKVEDEYNSLLRIKALSFAFFLEVIMQIISPIVDKVFFNEIEAPMNGLHTLLRLMIFYIAYYILQRKGWLTLSRGGK